MSETRTRHAEKPKDTRHCKTCRHCVERESPLRRCFHDFKTMDGRTFCLQWRARD